MPRFYIYHYSSETNKEPSSLLETALVFHWFVRGGLRRFNKNPDVVAINNHNKQLQQCKNNESKFQQLVNKIYVLWVLKC